MRRIKLARNIGFCSGVKRAIDIVERTLAESKDKVYSLGPVIHNGQVLKELENKNLRVINSLANLKEASTLILPSHGSPRNILNTAKEKKIKLIDVTCPYVSLVQKTCNMLYNQGLEVVIIGDRQHPEIKALMDLAPGAYTIDKIQDIKENMFSHKKIGIISQTTQTKDMFFEVISNILQKNRLVKEVHIFNTICLDTVRRQDEVKRLAQCVEVLLIIGSSTSANTKRLLSIGHKINKRTYLVENEDAVMTGRLKLKKTKTVGIISGASAPQWLVKKIIKKISKAQGSRTGEH